MQRPLERRIDDESLGWIMSIREMPHESGISIPVFEWSFGQEKGIRGGELRAWPIQGMLVFKDWRDLEGEDYPFESVERTLAKVDECGWGEPPHLDEVFQSLLWIKKQLLQMKSKEEAERIFNELREKWKVLIS